MDNEIISDVFYVPAIAAKLIGVKEATIKDYCRKGRAGSVAVAAKKVGPRSEWRILGSSLLAIRDAWQ